MTSRLYRQRPAPSDVRRPRQGIVINGQSGAAGRGNNIFLSPPALQTLLSSANDRVRLNDIEYTPTSPLTIMYDYTRSLQPRPFLSPTPNMGTELSIGNYVDSIQSDCFDLIKVAAGATSLAVEWDPDGAFPALPVGGPNLFMTTINRVLASATQLGCRIAAWFWVQGESDALDFAQASAYETNLTKFIARVRRYFPGVPFGISRISEQLLPSLYLYKELVRTAQVNVATNVPGCFFVDTDDLTLDSFKEYVPNSYAAIGYRAGPKLIRKIGILCAPNVNFTVQKSALSVQFTDLSSVINDGATVKSYAWSFGDGTTSSVQSPLHVYATGGAYTVSFTLVDTLDQSATSTQTITAAVPTWTVDATSGKGWPSSSAEWSQINTAHQLTVRGAPAPVPDFLYNFQEASGSVIDQIGGKNLVVTGLPTYHKLVGGWSRFAIGSNGTAVSQNANNTTLANINASSALVLAYFTFNNTAFFRPQLAMGGSAVNEIQCDLLKLRKRNGVATINGTIDHAGSVHPIVLRYYNEESIDDILTDLEQISLTYAPATGTSLIATFNSTSDAAASTEFLALAVWRGAAARRTVTEVDRLLQALAWATPVRTAA